MHGEGAPVEQWKDVCDLWCGAWFGERRRRRVAVPFGALADPILGRGSLPAHVAAPLLAGSRSIASRERFFHWTFEFPEIFRDANGEPLASPGFDAIIGNPPWEMLRGDRGDGDTRETARTAAAQADRLRPWFRRLHGAGRRSRQPLSVVPGADARARPQRRPSRHAAAIRAGDRPRSRTPAAVAHGPDEGRQPSLPREPRRACSPFIAASSSSCSPPRLAGAPPPSHAVSAFASAEVLDRLPELGPDPDAVTLTRPLLEQLSGEQIAVPDVRSRRDVDILHAIAFTTPALGDPGGWHVRFGRELNATDDRRHFARGLDVGNRGSRSSKASTLVRSLWTSQGRSCGSHPVVAATLVDPARTFERSRLGYREVASPTNRLTLIAAIVPAGTITTHTVFCLKDPLDLESQWYLCGMLNSFVANYLVRLRVSTHVSSGIIDRLPVPAPRRHAALQRNRRAQRVTRRTPPPLQPGATPGSRRWPRESTASSQPSFNTFSIRSRWCRGPTAPRHWRPFAYSLVI